MKSELKNINRGLRYSTFSEAFLFSWIFLFSLPYKKENPLGSRFQIPLGFERASAVSGGLGAEPPAGSGQNPGQGLGGRNPLENF
jgi:hypothetical protein